MNQSEFLAHTKRYGKTTGVRHAAEAYAAKRSKETQSLWLVGESSGKTHVYPATVKHPAVWLIIARYENGEKITS